MPAKKKTKEALDFNKLVGKRIKLYRTLSRMKLSEVAEKIGVSTAQVSTYERGTGDLRISVMKKLAETFRIPIYELFPEMENADYKPLDKNIVQLLTFIIEHNLDTKEIFELVKEYQREGLFKKGD